MIRFFIPGQPQSKERARSRIIKTKAGKQFTTHYTPKKTRDNENRIRTHAMQAMAGRAIIKGPVRITLRMGFEIPKSWPQWKHDMALMGKIAPTVRPDIDNVEKSIKDAFNGIVWIDDCQVVECEKVKFYTAMPGVLVSVREIVNVHRAQITRKEITASEVA